MAFGMTIAANSAKAQNNANNKEASKWVKSKVWADDLKVNIYPEVDAAEFKKQYESNKATWDKVFEFLSDSGNWLNWLLANTQ